MNEALLEKFYERIEPEPNSGCWLWTGVKAWTGYGRYMIDGKWYYVHRLAYEHFIGPLDGLQVDHLCRVRPCVNPAHMERVTNKENSRRGISFAAINSRKTHCPRGHPYDILTKRNKRDCRTCKRRLELERERRSRVTS